MNMVHSICRKSPRAVSKKETVYATRRRGEGAPLPLLSSARQPLPLLSSARQPLRAGSSEASVSAFSSFGGALPLLGCRGRGAWPGCF